MWQYFSPLLKDEVRKATDLTKLLQVFPELFPAVSSAELKFWPKLSPPPSRPHLQKEGDSEPDMLIRLETQAVVLVEAKCKSDVSSVCALACIRRIMTVVNARDLTPSSRPRLR